MKRVSVVILLAALIAAAAVWPAVAAPQYATGVVFHDVNRNGVRDAEEKGLPGVGVSNGRRCVKTDREGRYEVPVTDDTIVFVIKPRNWMTGLDANNIPRFYHIHKPSGSPELRFKGVSPTGPLPKSVDFPLYPRTEPDRFEVVFFGDTQLERQEHAHYLGHDIVEELAGTTAAFGITLGDVIGDNLPLYSSLVPTMGLIGTPWYHVRGNHDSNYDAAPNQKHINETFERVFGPSHYSFDYGPVHFIVLDNAYFGQGKGYIAYLGFDQMAFIRNDLAMVPKDQLVVLMMHIPIQQVRDRKALYELLKDRPHTFSLSAHTHTQIHRFIASDDGWAGAEPHHHLTCGTACGSWWSGAPDDVGLPHATMSDGTPNGYSIVTFDGNRYSVRYKVARRPADYQMNIYAPNEVASADLENTKVQVNVFAGSERSSVEMRVGAGGAWIPMGQVSAKDPNYLRLTEVEKGSDPLPGYKRLPGASNCSHLWEAALPKDTPAGTRFIEVRTTDMFGQTYSGRRVLTVK